MQTFITDRDWATNAERLDDKRLNKQLLEARQILNVLGKPEYEPGGRLTAWAHHPAVLMWKGCQGTLVAYAASLLPELDRRGIDRYKNWAAIRDMRWTLPPGVHRKPWWMANEAAYQRVIDTHRASLYRKDPEHYAQWAGVAGRTCCDRCNYYWPSHIINTAA